MNVTGNGVAIALAVAIALGFMYLGTQGFMTAGSVAESEAMSTTTNTIELPMATDGMTAEELPTELTITDLVVGTGAEATPGTRVAVNYVGTLPDGTVFDASANHGGPFSFALGAGEVIAGWDQGVAGMKVGGKRRLVIPPSMAYGNRAVGDLIPANSTLFFEVELVNVQ